MFNTQANQHAQATQHTQAPLRLLEIASGSGQHSTYLAQALPQLMIHLHPDAEHFLVTLSMFESTVDSQCWSSGERAEAWSRQRCRPRTTRRRLSFSRRRVPAPTDGNARE